MVGDGPMLEKYKAQYPSVYFTGFKTGVDLARYYANAEVFVFPSQADTFGLVIIEAMAQGTPVAAFPVQGPVDIIEQGVSGYMDWDLKSAVQQCLPLNRKAVKKASQVWTWDACWSIFKDNLAEITSCN